MPTPPTRASGTYEHARKWTPWLGERGLSVVTIAAPNTNIFDRESKRGIFIPAITVDRNNGSKGMLSRQCTDRWKIRPIRTKLRQLLGRRPRTGDIRALIGISLDEWHRMRSSDVKYIENVYPLVDLRMTRQDCVAWLQDHSLDIPPKSACLLLSLPQPVPLEGPETGGRDRLGLRCGSRRSHQGGPSQPHPSSSTGADYPSRPRYASPRTTAHSRWSSTCPARPRCASHDYWYQRHGLNRQDQSPPITSRP